MCSLWLICYNIYMSIGLVDSFRPDPPPLVPPRLSDDERSITKLDLEHKEIERSRNRGSHSPILIAIAVAGLVVALFSLLLIPVMPLPFMIAFSAGIIVYGATSGYVVLLRDMPLASRQAQIVEEIKKLRKKKPDSEIDEKIL